MQVDSGRLVCPAVHSRRADTVEHAGERRLAPDQPDGRSHGGSPGERVVDATRHLDGVNRQSR
jgi:hypothetical protein